MINVSLITPDSGDACSIYRGVGAYMRLPVNLQTYDGKKGFFLWEAIMRADVVVLQRPFVQQSVHLAETVRAAGKRLIVEWDDDLSCVPAWNPHHKHFVGCKTHLESIARLSDAVTVTTKALATSATEWGATDVRIVPNAIDDSWKTLPKLARRKIVCWRGSNTHSADLEIARPWFQEAKAAGYEVAIFGDAPAWAHELGTFRHFGVADYSNYLTLLNSLAPEKMFVPLVDHPFNRAKSDIAAQECYLIGADLVHNNVGEFAGLPARAEPRWLSETNQIRLQLLKDLTVKQ